MKKIIFLALSILLLNCSSDNTDERTNSLPTLTTNSITNIRTSKIISGGNILNDGGLEIISRGI